MNKMYYVFDNLGNIVNEGDGIENRSEAVADFKSRYTREEAEEYGFTLCRVTEEGGSWSEVIEEITADEIF